MNAQPILKVVIHGASGRMGQALLRLAAQMPDIDVVAAVARRAPSQRVIDGVPHTNPPPRMVRDALLR